MPLGRSLPRTGPGVPGAQPADAPCHAPLQLWHEPTQRFSSASQLLIVQRCDNRLNPPHHRRLVGRTAAPVDAISGVLHIRFAPSGPIRSFAGVPRPDFPRSILEYQQRFGDEDACRAYLFASRWPAGFSCPRCGGARAGEQPKRRLWECRACGHQTSVTAATVMHGTRTPLRVWFWAAYLVATHHPGISAVQLKRQLGLSR